MTSRTRAAFWILCVLYIALSFVDDFVINSLFRCPHEQSRTPRQKVDPREVEELKQHVLRLMFAIGEQSNATPHKLDAFGAYITNQWRKQGYAVIRQTGNANLVVDHPGKNSSEIVIIGAHYDSRKWVSGADDNASGVAALLLLSRRLKGLRTEFPIRFVAFDNKTSRLPSERSGSQIYAEDLERSGEKVAYVVLLKGLGIYNESRHSQTYPFPFSWFYPDQGNFIAFAGTTQSRGIVNIVTSIFRIHSGVPSECIKCVERWGTAESVPWTDHGSFLLNRYQTVMVTDTTSLRQPPDRTREDQPETLDYTKIAEVADGLFHVLRDMVVSPPE